MGTKDQGLLHKSALLAAVGDYDRLKVAIKAHQAAFVSDSARANAEPFDHALWAALIASPVRPT